MDFIGIISDAKEKAVHHARATIILAAAISASTASSYAHKAQSASLKPGHTANVHKAQREMIDEPALWLIGGGIIVGSIALAVANDHNNTPAATTTSTPSTTSTASTTGTSGR